MSLLDPQRLCEFADRGFLVVPNVVSAMLREDAMREIDGIVDRDPPPADRRGFHFYGRNGLKDPDPLLALVLESGAREIVKSLIAPLDLVTPTQAQVSLNIPPWKHRPGGPHLDGLTPPEPSGRPGTFTLLAGIFLTDQASSEMGNLWVWPGSHRLCAAYLRERGPDALFDIVHPTYPMAEPEQVVGRAGDLYLAHYMLGHNMGGNMSAQVRRVVYFRLKSNVHVERWRDCVRDELFEFAPVRAAVATGSRETQTAPSLILRPDDYRVMPWRNGLGSTREIAIHPPGAGLDELDWRVSIADVWAPGPFSTFGGCDRILVQIEGAPMTLSHEGGPERRLSLLEPYRFAGEIATSSTLDQPPARDFNVVVRRDVASADLSVHTLAEGARIRAVEIAETILVHVLRGTASVEVGGRPSRVVGGETLVASGETSITLEAAAGGAVALLVTIGPRRPRAPEPTVGERLD
jgi:environmental stress-induced protein Ves